MKNEHKIGVVVLMALSAVVAILLTKHFFFTQTREQVGFPVYAVSDIQEMTYGKYQISYPVLEAEYSNFNTAIRTFIEEQKNAFLSQAEENWKARYATRSLEDSIPEKPSSEEKFPFFVTWSQEQLNDRYVSIALEVYAFSGGAHGSTIIKTFNYDVKNRKFISLSDLYAGTPGYLSIVSDAAIAQLRQQQGDTGIDGFSGMLADGASPKPENFEAFTFSDELITIYFQQYQVGPYALGIPKVTLPRQMQQ